METNLNTQIEWIQTSLGFLLPELLITLLLVATLAIGLISKKQFQLLKIVSAISYVICALLILTDWPTSPVNLFNGMLRFDDFSSCFKLLFLSGGFLSILISNPEEKKHASEYFILIHAVVLGSCLLAMSMNFIMVLLSLELISLSSYVLAGFHQGSKSAEGSMKYFLFGAISTAVTIYGLSILFGQSGTLYFASEGFVSLLSNPSPLILFSGLLVLAGYCLKSQLYLSTSGHPMSMNLRQRL
jgi:NADH:ubiquinone oxidoreductase subunit 2 (chain N)